MPVHLKHRRAGHDKEQRIRVSKATHERLKQLTDSIDATADLAIWQLLDVYDLDRLDLIIDRVNKLYLRGITLSQRSQLSVLYALLAEIDNKIGLDIKYL